MRLQEVEQFFQEYNAAFDALDGDAVAAMWHDTSGICAGETITWWPAREPMRENMRELCEVYQQAGYVRAAHQITGYVPMGADAAFVNVAWTIEGTQGRVLQSFNTGYNLQRFAGNARAAIRVVLCTAYEENLNKLKEHAAH
jgi:hypothetical protein